MHLLEANSFMSVTANSTLGITQAQASLQLEFRNECFGGSKY
jgi:hypothetical protein